ncbi:uncharacterized protein CELE_Y52B11A.1 [Caenorhabditis elegans]|uniref:Uncharacterized protein n=1 Tax=Caenorhabditis elegans TaxID=6239 RepID=Q9XWF5_CAEEL|nr:Uncharacterized protein CELE_Y52B11A.1 [Caenorhabditis elegans]CAA21717.2 Uncharacterized protein CELE_Y52B11A.1 [Caenorhabditis elegans]|eukprot:NP_492853.2 Uncharacterized protein CELE_Y52B11A.1 [Caenorhabditis elegans]
MELGSPNDANYTVFCCSHVVLAFAIFMILDFTLTLFSFGLELFLIFFHDTFDQFWAIFHGISLVTSISAVLAICDNPVAIIVYGCRVMLILGFVTTRFIISMRDFTSKEEPTLSELLNLFQIVIVIMYTIGIFLVIRLFTYSAGRYRGYYDVDDDLKDEIRKKFLEYEADLDEKSEKKD